MSEMDKNSYRIKTRYFERATSNRPAEWTAWWDAGRTLQIGRGPTEQEAVENLYLKTPTDGAPA